MSDKIRLSDLIEKVQNKKFVLPDFQRNFVWKQDKMKKLFASVLCRMPIGSILTLKSSDNDFACKKIGAKVKSCKEVLTDLNNISYLIDGQQRLTSLFAGFTTFYFREYKDNKDDISSKDLFCLYFLKIPAVGNSSSEVKDIFNVEGMNFESKSSDYFSSSDIRPLIDAILLEDIDKKYKKNIFDVSNSKMLADIVDFCTSGKEDGYYRLPLQFYLDNKLVGNKFNTILSIIAEKYIGTFINLTDEEKKDKKEIWIDNVKSHLSICLSEMDLNLIEVDNSKKSRAIDIYTNLNEGGVKLSVFDLVMAKVGTCSSDNFYECLISYIQENILFNKNILSDDVQKWIECYENEGRKYNPAIIAEAVNDKDEITPAYINVFLNVLSLWINKQNNTLIIDDDKGKRINIASIKQEKLLDAKIKAEVIQQNAKQVCGAINKALLFFQTHCGIRRFSDVNYEAQISVIAYFFMDDKNFKSKKVHDFFEYWYWVSIFGYMYPNSQDIKIYNEIIRIENLITTNKSSKIDTLKYFHQHQIDVFNFKFYSDKETLTMSKILDTEKYPPAIMSKYICQYYLSLGYSDFFSNKQINVLCDEKLEIHHLMPLGSSPDLKIGQTTKFLRNKKKEPFNSPLNMLYITSDSNKKISNMDYAKYSQDSDVKRVLPTVGCPTVVGITDLHTFLETRYDNISAIIIQKLDSLYSSLEVAFK